MGWVKQLGQGCDGVRGLVFKQLQHQPPSCTANKQAQQPVRLWAQTREMMDNMGYKVETVAVDAPQRVL